LIIYKRQTIIDNRQGRSPLKPTDLVQGTLDLLILKTLSLQPMSGWSIAKRIVQVSQEVLQVQQGSLYPALHRLEHQGWIKAEWKASENNRRAKFYSLTAAGRKQLRSELDNWRRLSNAIGLVVEAT
jgi:PadR family transcriptional regulator PadR